MRLCLSVDQDLTGSGKSESRVLDDADAHRWYLLCAGVETIAHLREPGNGKLTIMFVAFEGGPRICRLYGTGEFRICGRTVTLNALALLRSRTRADQSGIRKSREMHIL